MRAAGSGTPSVCGLAIDRCDQLIDVPIGVSIRGTAHRDRIEGEADTPRAASLLPDGLHNSRYLLGRSTIEEHPVGAFRGHRNRRRRLTALPNLKCARGWSRFELKSPDLVVAAIKVDSLPAP